MAATFMASAAAPASSPPPLDADRITADRFGNDAPWYRDKIPLFESSEPLLDRVYYYRWQIVRAHQRDLGEKGYITTEFLDDVGWQREPYASLNDATPFHLHEARWLRDRRYVDDYLNFLYADGGNDRHFSESIADSAWARYLVDRDRDAAVRHLPAMRHVYGLWDDHLDFSKGLYWIEPLLDATEYTIASIDASGGKDGFTGGHAFRPSINSYMYANARAIGRIAALAGDRAATADYARRAEALKSRILDALWSPKLGHFVDRYRVHNEHVRYWDPVRGRELVGYLPWTFGVVDDPRFASAWAHLLSPHGFAGAAGLRTVEPSYEHYMRQYRYDKPTGRPECQWNGPVWPFQTTQVLMGMANLLRGPEQRIIGRGDYLRLLRQYAAMHLQGERLDLEEDYHPETGRPIVGLDRSHHYFHSGFNDLIVTGLVGLIPSAEDEVVVDPLVTASPGDPRRLRWFALQDVPYHGRSLTILYDEDGRRYGHGRGLHLYVDGERVAGRPDLGRLTASIAPGQVDPVARPINKAVQLVRTGFPRATASSGADAEALHDAIDGRVWFFPEAPNGWTSGAGRAEEWVEIDLGAERKLSSAELAFYADGQVAPPRSYSLSYWRAGGWVDLSLPDPPAPIANGVTRVGWAPIEARKIRLTLQKARPSRVRVVEVKLF